MYPFWFGEYPRNKHIFALGSNFDRLRDEIWTKATDPNTFGDIELGKYPAGKNAFKDSSGDLFSNILDGILLIKETVVKTASPQWTFGTFLAKSRDWATSNMCLFFCSMTLLCSNVLVQDDSCRNPFSIKNLSIESL